MNRRTKRRAIVFGAQGTLGSALVQGLPERGYDLTATPGRLDCDVTDPKAVLSVLSRAAPDVIFNAAAYTDVDRAETEPETSYAANALAPEILARAARDADASLVHYSTDFVFDGELERPYDEFDAPSPQGLYARSKLAGERLAQAAWPRVFILRVGCLYGRGGKNFPSTILRRLRSGETVRADGGRLGSPTWVRDVVTTSAALAATNEFGLYHCTSEGETTWSGYARLLAAELGLPQDRVEEVSTAALKMKAPRPRRAILHNRMLALRGLSPMPRWQDAARAFLAAEG